MLFSITSKDNSAQDLAKHLGWDAQAVERIEMPFGNASLFFSEFTAEKAEAVCLLEVDETKLLTERPFLGQGHPIQQYVHAKNYTSGAFMALAIGKLINKIPPSEVAATQNLEINLYALRSAVDAKTLQAWFRPLGWQLFLQEHLLDPAFPEWGTAQIYDLRIRGKASINSAMSQIQVLLCALDADHIFDLGIPETQSILTLAQQTIPQHPHFKDIYQSISNYPAFQNRLQLAGLFEFQDRANKVQQSTDPFAQHPETWSDPLLETIQKSEFKTILLFLTGNVGQLLEIVRQASIQQLCICHYDIAVLQLLAEKINASTFSEAEKRKFQLLVASPLYKDDRLKNFEVLVVQGFLAHFPNCHQAPIAEVMFGYFQAQKVLWLESEPTEFENWASGIAKVYPFAPQLTSIRKDASQYQIAIFDNTQTK